MNNDLTVSRFQTGTIDAATALQQLTCAQFAGTGSIVPPASGDMTLNQALEKLGLPVLSTPVGGMSLDSLMSAIGNEVRKQACKDGVNSLELRAQQQKEVNDKQLEQLAKPPASTNTSGSTGDLSGSPVDSTVGTGSNGSTGGPTPTQAKPAMEPKLVPARTIRISHPKPWLASEAELDVYLQKLREAWLKEIQAGNRVQI